MILGMRRETDYIPQENPSHPVPTILLCHSDLASCSLAYRIMRRTENTDHMGVKLRPHSFNGD
jgi:hypothetical protein